MRERFSYTGSKERLRFFSGGWWSGLLWLVIFAAFFYGVNFFGDYAYLKQKESLERAIRRDIAQCYAVEGIYPPGLSYLKEHYGLSYDEDAFFVDYRPIGSNLYPEVVVIERK